MVDHQYQQQGYGHQAMQKLIERLSRLPGGSALILNFHPANEVARRFYGRLGFVVYEESEHGCWARLDARAPRSSSAPPA